MKIRIVNNFHNTYVNLIVNNEELELSKSQMKRAKRTLCGKSDCGCGGTTHKSDIYVLKDSEYKKWRYILIENEDGTAYLDTMMW